MLDDLGLRDRLGYINGSDECRGLVALCAAVVERWAIIIVAIDILVIGRVDEDLVAIILHRPRLVEVIERMEESCDEMHRSCAQEDEKDVANQPGSGKAGHLALYPRRVA